MEELVQMVRKICLSSFVIFFLFLFSTYTHAAEVDLTWAPPTSGGPADGYIVYWSTTTGIYSDVYSMNVVGDISTTISGLDSAMTYYFIVRAYNTAGVGPGSNEVSWSNATPLMSPVVSGTSPTNDTTPTWNWSSGGGGNGTYRYRLDNSNLSTRATQTSSTSYTPTSALTAGSHALYVQERDASGFWSTSGSFTIVIDITATAAPTVSGTTPTNDTTPTWSWSSGGGGNGTYRYKLDNSDLSTGATQTTSSSFTPSSALLAGSHILYVQERDASGNWSASGSLTILINLIIPIVPTSPTVTGVTPTNDTTPTWSWTPGGGGNGTYRYKLDNSNFSTGATQTTNTSYTPGSALSDGAHTLYVQECNAAGNWSNSGSKNITIDRTAPDATAVLSEIDYSITSSGITIEGSNTGDVSKIRLYINNVFYTEIIPTSASWSYIYNGALDPGDVLKLTTVDAAGNESSNGVSHTYFNILTTTLQNGTVDEEYSLALEADISVVAWSILDGSLPDGLTLKNGVISGMPTMEGEEFFTIAATNSSGEMIEKDFTLAIDQAGTTEATITDPISATSVIVSCSAGRILNLQAQDPSNLAAPSNYNFPYGVFKFQIVGLAESEFTTITFDFEDTVSKDIVWYWYDVLTAQWTDISDDIKLAVNGLQVQITLTDGGVGDSDEVSGQITDPSGPALKSISSSSTSVASTSSSGGGGGGCFIATAAYGSPFESHVKILRKFRDSCLMQTGLGRGFVNLYYKYSPSLADIIRKNDSMRAAVRWGLAPVVGVAYVAMNTSVGEKVGILVIILGLVITCYFIMRKRIRFHHRDTEFTEMG
jgi:hypothetical protein